MKDLILKNIYYLSGFVYITDNLKNIEKKILHISDTPSTIFGGIIRLTRKLKPDIIIHTGDIVDDIKLGIVPQRSDIYIKQANYFLSSLAPHVKDRIIIVPGNHDLVEKLSLVENIDIYNEGEKINIEGIQVGLSHKYENLPVGSTYYLYGHDNTEGVNESYLNGIQNINIIDTDKQNVIKLPYPAGTNDSRLKRTKIGI